MTPATMERNRDASKKLVPFTLSLDMRQYAEGEAHSIPDAIHVAPIGKWDHPLYGEFEVTRETVREFIGNFEAGIRKAKLPITAGHDVFEEHAAIGWMVELYEGPRGLYAKVEWTTEGEALLREGKFKYFSPEWFTSYNDPATLREHGHVLIGGALTNKPFFRELDDVVAFSEYVIHQQSFTMNLDEIRKKEAADLTDEEKAFLKDNEAELSEEEKGKFFPEDNAGDDAGDDAGNGDDDQGDDPQTPPATDPNQASTVTISAAELKALRDKADQGHQAYSQLRTMTLENEASALVFSRVGQNSL